MKPASLVLIIFFALVAFNGCSQSGDGGSGENYLTEVSEYQSILPVLDTDDSDGVAESGVLGDDDEQETADDTGISCLEPRSVHLISGDMMFLASAYRKLYIIDLTDSRYPRVLNQLGLSGRPIKIFQEGEYLLVVSSGSPDLNFDPSGELYHTATSHVDVVTLRGYQDAIITDSIALEGYAQEATVVDGRLFVGSREGDLSLADSGEAAEAAGLQQALNLAGVSETIQDISSGSEQETNSHLYSIDIGDPETVAVNDSLSLSGDYEFYFTDSAVFLIKPSDSSLQLDSVSINANGGFTSADSLTIPVSSFAGWSFREGFLQVLGYGDESVALFAIDARDPVDMGLSGATGAEGSPIDYKFMDNRLYLVSSNSSSLQTHFIASVFDLSVPESPVKYTSAEILDAERLEIAGASGPFLVLNKTECISQTEQEVCHSELVMLHESNLATVADYLYFDSEIVSVDVIGNMVAASFAKDDGTYRTKFIRINPAGELDSGGDIPGYMLPGCAAEYRGSLVLCSTNRLLMANVSNYIRPQLESELILAYNAIDFGILGQYGVAFVNDCQRSGSSLLTVSADAPDINQPLASVAVSARAESIHTNGGFIYLLISDCASDTCSATLEVYDYSDPLNPFKRGSLEIEEYIDGRLDFRGDKMFLVYEKTYSESEEAEENTSFTPVDGFSEDEEMEEPRSNSDQSFNVPWEGSSMVIQAVDISNPDNPAPADSIAINAPWISGLTYSIDTAYFTHYQESETFESDSSVCYYFDRLDISDINALALVSSINIPGCFAGISENGEVIYSIDYQYVNGNYFGVLNALYLVNNAAYLQSSLSVGDNIKSFFISGSWAYLVSEEWNAGEKAIFNSKLFTVDLSSAMHLRLTDTVIIDSSSSIADVISDFLFVRTGYDYLSEYSIFSLEAPQEPAYTGYYSTSEAERNEIAAGGSRIYIPAGYFGVGVMELN